jgi:hypothetical protein
MPADSEQERHARLPTRALSVTMTPRHRRPPLGGCAPHRRMSIAKRAGADLPPALDRMTAEAQEATEEILPGISVDKRYAGMREAFGDALVTRPAAPVTALKA